MKKRSSRFAPMAVVLVAVVLACALFGLFPALLVFLTCVFAAPPPLSAPLFSGRRPSPATPPLRPGRSRAPPR